MDSSSYSSRFETRAENEEAQAENEKTQAGMSSKIETTTPPDPHHPYTTPPHAKD